MWPLVIPNVFEFNRRHLGSVQAKPDELFSQTSFVLAALPAKEPLVAVHKVPSADLANHWKDRLGFSPRYIEVPPVTGKLCRDILAHANIVKELLESGHEPVFWGTTAESEELLRILGFEGSPPGVAVLIDLLNGKAGNKALVDQLTVLLAPDWSRCPAIIIPANTADLNSALSGALEAWGSVIVKPGMTWGGKGTTAVLDTDSLAAAIEDFSKASAAVTGSYFVAEPLLGDPPANLSPSIDWNPMSGRAVVGRMIMSGFSCTGTAFGLGALGNAQPHRGDFANFCEGTARYLRSAGYSRWFDVDILDTGRSIYVSEFNLRHTGGTVPIRLADFLLGSDWETAFAVTSVDGLQTHLTFAELVRDLYTHGFDDRGTNIFVVTNYERTASQSRFSIWLSSPDPEVVHSMREYLLAMQ